MFRAIFLLLSFLACSKCRGDDCCCPNSIEINAVPFEITTSNTTYCVTQNLTYLSGVPTAAITVDPGVHDIVIDFNGFELDLDPSVNGIEMLAPPGQGITDVIIKDGVIKSISPSNANSAVRASNFNTLAIENMHFIDTRRGFVTGSAQTDTNVNLTFRSCVFDLNGATGAPRRGISISTIQGLKVEDCTFLPYAPDEPSIGILLVNNAKDIQVRRTTFDGQQTALLVQSLFDPDNGFFFTFPACNFLIEECEFNNDFIDTQFVGASNIEVTNSTFYGTASAPIIFEAADDGAGNIISPLPSGLLVDSCIVTMTGEGELEEDIFSPVFLFAGTVEGSTIAARDIIIQNSIFSHQGASAPTDGLNFCNVEGILIENNVIDLTASGRLDDCEPPTLFGVPVKIGAIHFGGPLTNDNISAYNGGIVRDATVRGNQILGGSQIGIYSTTSIGTTPNERITIEDNSITATEAGILFENTRASSILNNRVQGVRGDVCADGVGIEFAGATDVNDTAASTSNAVIGNIVSNNITGIRLDCGAQGNLVKDNFVFNNDSHQIKEEKKHSNKIEGNTVFDHQNEELSCSSSS